MALVFNEVHLSADVAAKLGSKHGVALEEVEEALSCHDLAARWQSGRDGGEQLLCRGRTDEGRALAVVLYPVGSIDEGRWRLATAYPDPHG